MINVSEGRNLSWLDALAAETPEVVDVHVDAAHHRSVFTLLGTADALEDAVLDFARRCFNDLDVRRHVGVHPRIGVLDVVPFVPLGSATLEDACGLRDRTGSRLAEDFGVPVFFYGPLADGSQRTLPELRKQAFTDLVPDRGPALSNPRMGASAFGAREVLVAWNMWLAQTSLSRAKSLAASVRSESVRSLGLDVGTAVQVSCNLIAPNVVGPDKVYDAVAAQLEGSEQILRSELVGLLPRVVLESIAPRRYAELDVSEEATIEAAAERRGLRIL